MDRDSAQKLLVNIDVPDIAQAETFYTRAFDLRPGRRFGEGAVELLGSGCRIYLLQNEAGSLPFEGAQTGRSYNRHWSPIHLDFVVSNIDEAIAKAVGAGAKLESPAAESAWGKLAVLADPFGNGFCFVEFTARGYDAIANPGD